MLAVFFSVHCKNSQPFGKYLVEVVADCHRLAQHSYNTMCLQIGLERR
jgi:hypothetical protein